MAKYRQVHTTFWDDGFVLDLTPEEKYFYLYLMTNGNTTQCGIYELPYRVIEMHTGYNRETVLKLLQRFVEYGKITYNESTKEIMINNWARYNFINSPKVKKCIEKELVAVKHIPFVHAYLTSLKQYGYSIDTVSIPPLNQSEPKDMHSIDSKGSIPYQYPMDSLCIDLGEEEEKEKEQEQEQEREEEQQQENVGQSVRPSSDFAKLVDFTNNNIQPVAQAVGEKLGFMLDDYKDADLIIEALKESIMKPDVKNKYTYAEGILRNWKNELITNLEQLNTKRTREANQHGSNGISNGRSHAKATGKGIDDVYRQLERDKQAWGN